MVVLGVLSALLVPALMPPLHYDVKAVGRLISPLIALFLGVAGFVIHRRRRRSKASRPPR